MDRLHRTRRCHEAADLSRPRSRPRLPSGPTPKSRISRPSSPFLLDLAEAGGLVKARPVTPSIQEIYDAAEQNVHAYLTDQVSLDEAVTAAMDKITQSSNAIWAHNRNELPVASIRTGHRQLITDHSPLTTGVLPLFGQQNLSTRRILLAWLLVTPVVLWRLLTSVYPFLRTFYISFFDNSPVRRTFDFVGLDNYIALTRDSNVDATLTFTLFFTVTSVILQVVFGLAIAELLNQRFRMRNLTRAVNLLPWAMAPIVIATAARWIFHQDYGLINDIIWRLSGERPLWLVNFTTARFAVTITDVWKNTAFLSVIFSAASRGSLGTLRGRQNRRRRRRALLLVRHPAAFDAAHYLDDHLHRHFPRALL